MNEGDYYDCLLMIMEKAIRGKFKKMIMQLKNCTGGLKKKARINAKKKDLGNLEKEARQHEQ